MNIEPSIEDKQQSKEMAETMAKILIEAEQVPYSHACTINTSHEHTSGKGIYAVSRRVKRYADVKETAARMTGWINANNGRFPAPYVTAYAISHCQIEDEPVQMFVVSKELIRRDDVAIKAMNRLQNEKNFFFPSQIILNAEILESPEKVERDVPSREVKTEKDGKVTTEIKTEKKSISNKIFVDDACMSFPKRTQKKTERYYRIKVRYQIKGLFGLKTITEWVEGLKSHIFQHEIDHQNAINIYYGKAKMMPKHVSYTSGLAQ